MPNADKGTQAGSRLVPIRDDMAAQFQKWRAADGNCPWVINYHGKQVKHIDHAWHKARIAAGIARRITPYSLRHAFATEALEHGADINAVAQIMGHSDPTMILKVYQYIRLHKLREAVNLIPKPTGDK